MEQQSAELPLMHRAWAWFETNKKQVAWGAGGVVVVGLAIAFYQWRQAESLVAAGEAVSAVEALSAVGGRARNESADAYLKVAAQHAGTLAGARAALQAAVILFTQGRYADAQAQFEKFNREYPEAPFRSQALLGIASCLDALVKPDEAARAYNDLVTKHPGQNVVPQAKFALARIYESQGKFEQARPLYEELARGETSGSLANEAGLKLDELRAKMPAPAVTPTTSSPTPLELPLLSTPLPLKTNQP